MLPAIPVPSKPLRQPMHPFRDIVNTTPIRQREGTEPTSTYAIEPICGGGGTASLAPGRPDGSSGAPSPKYFCALAGFIAHSPFDDNYGVRFLSGS